MTPRTNLGWRLLAVLRDRRRAGRIYVVTVECPACSAAHRVALAGWTAIVCRGCGAELHRRMP